MPFNMHPPKIYLVTVAWVSAFFAVNGASLNNFPIGFAYASQQEIDPTAEKPDATDYNSSLNEELYFACQHFPTNEDEPTYTPLPELDLESIPFPQINPQPPTSISEGRALWVCRDALTSTESIVRLVEIASLANINTLFVQVRGAGDAYYLSQTEPRPFALSSWPDNSDPLQMVIFLAHQRGIQVHAWLNILYAAPGEGYQMADRHILKQYPDWVLEGRDLRDQWDYTRNDLDASDCEGLYLNPFNSEVGDYLCQVVKEILDNYAVDGIHLDFIRFPNIGFGYGPVERQEFQDLFSVDPLDIAYGELSDNPGDNLANLWLDTHLLQWYAFRAAAVDRVVCKISQQISESRPDCILSAAVWANRAIAYRYVGQDWLHWVKEGWVDLLCPMAYWKMPYGRLTELCHLVKSAGGRIYLGLGAYIKDERTISQEIDEVRKSGADGFALFSYNDMFKKQPMYLYNLQQICLNDDSPAPEINHHLYSWYLRWHPYLGPPQLPSDPQPYNTSLNLFPEQTNTAIVDIGDASQLFASDDKMDRLAALALSRGYVVRNYEVKLVTDSAEASGEKALNWQIADRVTIAKRLLVVKMLDDLVYPKVFVSTEEVDKKYKTMSKKERRETEYGLVKLEIFLQKFLEICESQLSE
jgi:uncharacterized lipoprotein YddW (UPF0748 family)